MNKTQLWLINRITSDTNNVIRELYKDYTINRMHYVRPTLQNIINDEEYLDFVKTVCDEEDDEYLSRVKELTRCYNKIVELQKRFDEGEIDEDYLLDNYKDLYTCDCFETETRICGWCGDTVDVEELEEERDFGFLCRSCIGALYSRGERLHLIRRGR